MQAQLTAQEVFDKVVKHLYKQGRPAMADDGSCRYRAPKGRTCAVGCLIPDDEYDPVMEFNVASGLTHVIDTCELKAPITKTLVDQHEELLVDLQLVHDSGATQNKDGTFSKIALKKQLTEVAQKYNLVFTIPK